MGWGLLFPTIEDEALETVPDERLGTVFLFDFNNKSYVIRDGKLVVATYEEAIKQWVTMLLITEINKYEIYKSSEFGISLSNFIGRRDLPTGVIASEAKRMIEEKALLHPEIEAVNGFSVTRNNGVASIAFNIQTQNGIIPVTSEVKVNA